MSSAQASDDYMTTFNPNDQRIKQSHPGVAQPAGGFPSSVATGHNNNQLTPPPSNEQQTPSYQQQPAQHQEAPSRYGVDGVSTFQFTRSNKTGLDRSEATDWLAGPAELENHLLVIDA